MTNIEDIKFRQDIKRSLRKAKSTTFTSLNNGNSTNGLSKKLVSRKLQATLKRQLKQLSTKASVKKQLSSTNFDLSSGNSKTDFPILINGAVGTDTERADSSYWDPYIIAVTARETGYMPSEFSYVDGDQGMWPGTRRKAGLLKGKSDAKNIWNRMKLSRNEEGLVTEQLQVMTHSRGSVFGAAYMESLTNEIKILAKNEGVKFAYGEDNIIEYSINLGPHQSNSLNYPENGSTNINISHFKDILSGNDAQGNVINVHSNALDDSADPILEHGNGTFMEELEGILELLENDKGFKLNELINMYKRIERETNKSSTIYTGNGLWVK